MKLHEYAYIDLPAPNASRKDLHMSAEEVKRARLYFQKLANLYHLYVKKPKPGMQGGAAHFASNTVYVPTIKNRSDFYLCLHEVGHMGQLPALLKVMDLNSELADEAAVIDEYIAEMFALEHAQLFGLDTAIYEKHAKRYVCTYVQKVHQKGTKWTDLHERVRDIIADWLCITEADWSAHKWRFAN